MRKMIALQKMMFQTYLFYPTRIPKGQRKPSGENIAVIIIITILFFILSIISGRIFTSNALGFIYFLYPATLTIYRIITSESFIYNLPLKRSAIIFGVFLFTVTYSLLIILFFLCITIIVLVFAVIFNASWLSPDTLLNPQEFIIEVLYCLLFVNTAVVAFYFKRPSIKIIGCLLISILQIIITFSIQSRLPMGSHGHPTVLAFLKATPNSWLTICAAIIFFTLITVLEIQLAIWIDQYNRRLKPSVIKNGSES